MYQQFYMYDCKACVSAPSLHQSSGDVARFRLQECPSTRPHGRQNRGCQLWNGPLLDATFGTDHEKVPNLERTISMYVAHWI